MARTYASTEVDEIERIIRLRNAIASRNLLDALRLNHGGGSVVMEQEVQLETIPPCEPEVLPEPEPEPIPEVIPFSMNKVEQIKRLVCRRYSVPKSGIESKSRRASVVRPRQIGMYLAREYTTHSFPEIGRRFGGRDHTTILYAHGKIKSLIAKDEKLAREIKEILAELPA